jgi:hypothetical protein
MGISGGPYIVRDSSLVLELDAADRNSYVSGSTVWRDLTANSFTGSLTNGPTFSSDNLGSIVFDGTNDYMIFTSSSNYSYGTNNFSIDYWINFNSLTSTQQSLLDAYSSPSNSSSGGTFGFVVTNTQIITYANNGVIFTSSSISLPVNTWINLSFVRSSGTLYIYRNSLLIDSAPCSWNFQFTGNATLPFLYIGINPGANGNYFNGKIGNFRIYKERALSASEILQNYNALKSRFNL